MKTLRCKTSPRQDNNKASFFDFNFNNLIYSLLVFSIYVMVIRSTTRYPAKFKNESGFYDIVIISISYQKIIVICNKLLHSIVIFAGYLAALQVLYRFHLYKNKPCSFSFSHLKPYVLTLKKHVVVFTTIKFSCKTDFNLGLIASEKVS